MTDIRYECATTMTHKSSHAVFSRPAVKLKDLVLCEWCSVSAVILLLYICELHRADEPEMNAPNCNRNHKRKLDCKLQSIYAIVTDNFHIMRFIQIPKWFHSLKEVVFFGIYIWSEK